MNQNVDTGSLGAMEQQASEAQKREPHKESENLNSEQRTYRPAGFLIRLLAYLIDLTAVNALGLILAGILGFQLYQYRLLGISLVGLGLVGALYFILLTRWLGQTLGKMITGIRVIDTTGSHPDWLTTVFREGIGRVISQLMGLHLGYLWCAFHPRKQGWHDLISDTYVVYDPQVEKSRALRL